MAKKAEIIVVDESLREQAKTLFMQYVDFNQISKQLKISTHTLATWRKRDGWSMLREETEREIIEDAFAGRRVAISKITKSTVEQIERGLSFLRSRPTPPSIQEVERLSVILSNLDKISRLDANKSTENIALQANVKLTSDEIRSIIASDPFLKKE